MNSLSLHIYHGPVLLASLALFFLPELQHLNEEERRISFSTFVYTPVLSCIPTDRNSFFLNLAIRVAAGVDYPD
jgi:hypothetical protein